MGFFAVSFVVVVNFVDFVVAVKFVDFVMGDFVWIAEVSVVVVAWSAWNVVMVVREV